MTTRIWTFFVALASIGIITACDDPASPDATVAVYTIDSQTVYSLNGSPANAPTAIYFISGSTVRANQSFRFDLAFDIDAQGRAVVLPVREVANEIGGGHLVGLQLIENTHYDSLKRAPESGYKNDSTFVVGPGALFAVRTEGTSCSIYVEPAIYAKLLILEVNAAERLLRIKYTVDPNCGFKALTNGVPKD